MLDHSLEDRLCLYLASVEDGTDAATGMTSSELATALGLGTTTVAGRISMISALTTLQDEGFVEERRVDAGKTRGERSVYRLTESGRARAGEFRARIEDQPLRVRTSHGDVLIPLHAVDSYLDANEAPMASALSAATEDGVLVLEDEMGDDAFVDREAEREWLRTRFERASAEGAVTARVSGDAGIGKTSLLRAFGETVESDGGLFLMGRCIRDVSEPYGSFLEALDGHPEYGPVDRIRTTLEEVSGFDPTVSGDFEDERRARFAEIATMVRELAHDRPLVLCLDDAQWIDHSTAALVGTIAERVETAPLLLVISYRSGDVTADHPLATVFDERSADHLEIEPFDRATTGELVHRLVGTRAVPDRFVDSVFDRLGGIPLFVEECVSSLLETGDVDPRIGVYPDGPDEVRIPDDVESSIVTRIDAFGAEAREVLAIASVVGERIHPHVLEAVASLDPSTVRTYVDLLVDATIWDRTDDGNRLRFASPVVRETIYETIEPGRRETLHRAVADAYRTLDDHEPSEERAATIARHYHECGERERAIEYYLQAGDHAESVYALELATETYERALTCARERDDETAVQDILERMGDISHTLGDFGDARKRFEYVAERTTDPEVVQRTCRKRSRAHWQQGSHDEALELANRGLELVDEDGAAPTEECRLRDSRAMVFLQTGEETKALEEYERALEVAEEIGDETERARALQGIGSAKFRLGEITDAEEPIETAIATWKNLGNEHELATAFNALGAVRMRTGDEAGAADAFTDSLERFEEIGHRRGQSTALNNLGLITDLRGDPKRAREYYEDGLEIARALDDAQNQANLLINLGSIDVELGRLDGAIEHSREAIELAESIGDRGGLAAALDVQAGGRYYRDELDAALRYAERARDVAAETDDKSCQADANWRIGYISRERGAVETAIEAHERALELSRRFGNEQKALENREGLILARLADDPSAASEHVEAIERGEDRAELYAVALGPYYHATGDHERALELLTEGIEDAVDAEKRPTEAELLVERARVRLELGEHDAASEDVERARAIATEHGIELVATRCRSLLESM
ncbi:ATP-binding protein [Halovivax limisalsi]|uniref:ATP-binding protein n=1 Tax=Halovivax limisalsi TaxID=1453760 RepID=UPI001FFDD012|nr:tetratricopeptide repeat protein [Halovivax limisalsi]